MTISPADQPTTQPHNALTVRVAQYRDLPALASLLVDSFQGQGGLSRWLRPLLRLGTQEDLRYRISSGAAHYICLVAVIPDRTGALLAKTSITYAHLPPNIVAGTVEMGVQSTAPWPMRHSHYLYISSLAVHRDYRQRGIARELMLNCEKTARIMGFPDLYLHVMADNAPARQLYQTMGYQITHRDSDWFGAWSRQPQRLLLHKHLLPLTAQSQW